MSKHRQTPCWKVCRVEVKLMTRHNHKDCCDYYSDTKSVEHLKAGQYFRVSRQTDRRCEKCCLLGQTPNRLIDFSEILASLNLFQYLFIYCLVSHPIKPNVLFKYYCFKSEVSHWLPSLRARYFPQELMKTIPELKEEF